MDRALLGPQRQRAHPQRHIVDGLDRGRIQAAQDGAQSRGEFARRAGLGDVIVGAELQTQDAVDIVSAGGEHQNRNGASRTKPAQDFDARHARHHHVQHDDVMSPAQRLADRHFAVVRQRGLEPVLTQIVSQQGAEFDIVVDEQDAWRHGRSRGR